MTKITLDQLTLAKSISNEDAITKANLQEKNYPKKQEFTWQAVLWNSLLSRAIDELEETKLFAEKKISMQFSAKGHELAQTILGAHINHPCDGVAVYYRSRPLMISLGLPPTQALAGPLARESSLSKGRDGGMVFNREGLGSRPTILPMCGDVGSQFTQCVGWAQAVKYRIEKLGDKNFQGAISVAMGGDGSIATGGFWSALNIATTLKLPMLFFIEDNGYAISTPSIQQTPGGDIAKNLASFSNLSIFNGDGTDPAWLSENIQLAVNFLRNSNGPALIRVKVPRLCGHSIQDKQSYKEEALLQQEKARDPLFKLRKYLVPNFISETEWQDLETRALEIVEHSLNDALLQQHPDSGEVSDHIFHSKQLQLQGGIRPDGYAVKLQVAKASLDTNRVNMADAIRRTLEAELHKNERLVIFGQDVGVKGGIHGVTSSLQRKFCNSRIFDTNLSEEGIVGRSTGMALCGLLPCPEIQFRKYADAAMEQIRNIGTLRWRTANKFAAPMVLRMTVGSTGREDHWHNLSDESIWAHLVGWQVVIPSNTIDAVGLLRSALRGNDPVMFLEHRALLDGISARRPYPGDEYILPFGEANIVCEGSQATIVSWGACVDKCEQAIRSSGYSVELIDLRTISPWDRETVCNSVRKTGHCLIVHEDNLTCGFGAEISAVLSEYEIFSLQAPIMRLAVPNVPIPYYTNPHKTVVPTPDAILSKLCELMSYT